jgi:hypothetical protein
MLIFKTYTVMYMDNELLSVEEENILFLSKKCTNFILLVR